MKKITIILTRYNESNKLIIPGLKKLSTQEKIKGTVLFLDQKKDVEIKKLCKKLSNQFIKFIYKNISKKSLSHARNIGIKLAKTEIVLFLDSDAIPEKDWAIELIKGLNSPNTAIVGSKSSPLWKTSPKWYNKTGPALEVYSIFNPSNNSKEVNRIVGVGFGINKKLLGTNSYFNENLGRRPGSLLGGEETELCNRAREKGLKIYYISSSKVKHQIQQDRMGFNWLMNRFFYGGIGKAYIKGTPEIQSKQYSLKDKIFILIISPAYIAGYIYGRLKNVRKIN
jgi:GT2 family glycosyltransferase